MVKKTTIAYIILFAISCYFIAPWLFEKKMLVNELFALVGFVLFSYKRFRFGNDVISICMVVLITWGGFHLLTSLFTMDHPYYYLRNSVIVYSMFSFFIGYFLLKYLNSFFNKIGVLIKTYLVTFLLVPISPWFFDRFSTATLFPAIFKDVRSFLVPWLIISLNIIQAFAYESSTAIIVAAFNFLIFFSPGYKFFKQVSLIMFLAFTCLFIYLLPYLDLIGNRYSPWTYDGIFDVANSHPILSVDHNSTWRLILWKQIIVDNFPRNLLGYGFGTPMIKYYPVEDYSKLETLPYVVGAHNSFVYLFGRLGLVYVLLTLKIYSVVFREYYYFKQYYYRNNQSLIFLSFFAMTIITIFNPTLETPIYAGIYWVLLGFTARAIHDRQYSPQFRLHENLIYT